MSNIVEGANSTIKTITPSFATVPFKQGAMLEQERAVFVDEVGKMVEKEANKHQQNNTNILGELNALLDNKRRAVGSGNDNDAEIQATCKAMMVTNPQQGKPTIYRHVGLIDATTMSRFFHWVQDKEELEFVLSQKGIIRPKKVPLTLAQAHPYKEIEGEEENKENKIRGLDKGKGKVGSRDEFLTLFDSCYSFVCEVDEDRVQTLCNLTITLAREPMKKSVWEPRAFHHIYLLIDGLVKHRCLFKDYDPTFTPKPEDYDLAERILIRMVKGWDTDLSPKEDFRR